MSNVSKRRKEGSRAKIKSMGDHKEFLKRITKTLYYGQLPTLPCLSLPVTEISCEVWSMAQRGRSLRRLHADAAAGIARSACVSPCALVLAVLYLERLRTANPDYLAATSPADLFLVSLMVGNKFLQDDGEDDEVICSEWAASGGMDLKQLKKLEVEFLSAIDWNVFVSEKSFETGLQRLERRVALKEARARGFFTYADLIAATAPADGALLPAVARGAGAGWLAALGAYLASLAALLALVASAALLARASPPLRAPATPAARSGPARVDPSHAITLDIGSEADLAANITADLAGRLPTLDEADAAERPRCCTRWARPAGAWGAADGRRPRVGAAPEAEARSTAALLDWLYRSSLVDPVQRWLQRLNEYGALLRRELAALAAGGAAARGSRPRPERCGRRGLDLSRVAALVAVSDR